MSVYYNNLLILLLSAVDLPDSVYCTLYFRTERKGNKRKDDFIPGNPAAGSRRTIFAFLTDKSLPLKGGRPTEGRVECERRDALP